MVQRLLILLAFILAAIYSFGQSFGQAGPQNPNQPQKPTPEGNCTVRGQVISAADGSPLRSARVGLVQADTHDHPQVYGDTTDNQGRFELKKVLAGRYRFFASHIGYLDQSYQAKSTERGQGAVLSLLSQQEVTDVLFRLVRAGVITGKVVDDAGEPMIGVSVTVLRKPSEEELEDTDRPLSMTLWSRRTEMMSVSVAGTDDRGEYRIFGLRPGEYYVKANETGMARYMSGGQDGGMGQQTMMLQVLGSQFAPMYFPGVLQLDQAQPVVLRAGEEVQADFTMRRIKLVEVAGRVMGADGGPETKAYVHLSAVGIQDWFSGLGTSTDSKGQFSIKGVPPGTYYISTGTYERGRHTTRKKIEVGESNVDSIVLSLSGGATIHGRVVGGNSRAPAHAAVVLQPTAEEAESEPSYTEVEKDGSFELQGVMDGSYALQVYLQEQGSFMKSAHFGNEDAFQKGVQVEDGAAKGNLEIVVSTDGAQLEGTVTESDKNQPLVGAQIKLSVDPENEYNRERSKQVNTDQNGHYLLKDLPPGKYKVTARISSPVEGAPAIKSDPVAVALAEHEHRTVDIKLTFPKSE